MNIIEFQKEQYILEYLKNCEWGAAKFLYELIVNNSLYKTLGKDTKIIVLVDGENVVSFATYANQDCIDDMSLFPWIGFVYTDEAYRGNRYSQKVIEYIKELAKKDNYSSIYLATDHIGLYEKYGFIYIESRIDVYDDESRIYTLKV